MTGVQSFLSGLKVAPAASWPTFWVVYAINVAITFASSFGVDAAWWQRLVAISLGQVAMFAVVAVGAAVERRRGASVTRGLLALMWFALAGAARGGVVGLAFTQWGATSQATETARLASGVLLGLAILTPMSVLVSAARDFARTRDALLDRADQLSAAAARVTEDMAQRDEGVVERIKEEISDSLDEDGAASAARLDRVLREVIRPLSHDLAAAVPTWTPPAAIRRQGRVEWRQVVDRALSGQPLMPWTTTGLIALLSLASVVYGVGPARTAPYYLVGAVLVVSALMLGNVVLGRALPDRPFATRVVITAGVLLLGGAYVGGVGALVVDLTGGPNLQRLVWRAFFALLILMPLLAFTVSLARAATQEQIAALDRLRDADRDLKRRLTRLRQTQWSQQRALARALHGPVQALVSNAAARLHSAPEAQVTHMARDLERELVDVLDPDGRVDDRVTWTDGLARIEATWEGVVDVSVSAPEDVLAWLAGDPVTCDLAVEIVSEAVSNAARHGDAGSVRVSLMLEGEDVVITVRDDGIKGLGDGSGMGSRLLDDCCLEWSRVGAGSGVTLTARLPVGP